MMALEHGIARLVEEFIAAGRPSSRQQNIDDRRAGYVASAVLAGESETRVQVDDITLEGINFRVVSPQNAAGPLPTQPLSTITAAVLSAAASPPTINNGVSWRMTAAAG